jgi:hypothetical protein
MADLPDDTDEAFEEVQEADPSIERSGHAADGEDIEDLVEEDLVEEEAQDKRDVDREATKSDRQAEGGRKDLEHLEAWKRRVRKAGDIGIDEEGMDDLDSAAEEIVDSDAEEIVEEEEIAEEAEEAAEKKVAVHEKEKRRLHQEKREANAGFEAAKAMLKRVYKTSDPSNMVEGSDRKLLQTQADGRHLRRPHHHHGAPARKSSPKKLQSHIYPKHEDFEDDADSYQAAEEHLLQEQRKRKALRTIEAWVKRSHEASKHIYSDSVASETEKHPKGGKGSSKRRLKAEHPKGGRGSNKSIFNAAHRRRGIASSNESLLNVGRAKGGQGGKGNFLQAFLARQHSKLQRSSFRHGAVVGRKTSKHHKSSIHKGEDRKHHKQQTRVHTTKPNRHLAKHASQEFEGDADSYKAVQKHRLQQQKKLKDLHTIEAWVKRMQDTRRRP